MKNMKNKIVHKTQKGNETFNYLITSKCNNNCVMCIHNSNINKNIDLEFSIIKDDFLELKDIYSDIFISGGEPTMHPKFFHILNLISKKFSSQIQLLTNARIFCYNKFINNLNNLNIKNIIFGIPFYSCEKKIFESISRTPNSYNQAITGIGNLLKYDYDIELRIIIHKLNYKTLPDISHYVLKNFPKIKKIFFANMDYIGNGFKNKKILYVEYKKVKPYLEKALDIINNKFEINVHHMPFCELNKKYWKHIAIATVVPQKHIFLKKCNNCILKEKCCGFWKNYLFVRNLMK